MWFNTEKLQPTRHLRITSETRQVRSDYVSDHQSCFRFSRQRRMVIKRPIRLQQSVFHLTVITRIIWRLWGNSISHGDSSQTDYRTRDVLQRCHTHANGCLTLHFINTCVYKLWILKIEKKGDSLLNTWYVWKNVNWQCHFNHATKNYIPPICNHLKLWLYVRLTWSITFIFPENTAICTFIKLWYKYFAPLT